VACVRQRRGSCKLLSEALAEHGITSEVVTGTDAKTDRDEKIASFKAGRLRCLINVNVLTAGFNHPATDLVAMVRATASPGLYVQMCGRGTRIAEGKTDCLLLDFGGNVERHGFIDAVQIKDKSQSKKNGDAPVKECPECQTMCHAALRFAQAAVMSSSHPSPPTTKKPISGAVLSSQVVAEWVDVDDVEYKRHKKDGKPDSVRVIYKCGLQYVSEWLCPDHGGYAASRYVARMPALGAKGFDNHRSLD
jgi:DNA repair protein RadD